MQYLYLLSPRLKLRIKRIFIGSVIISFALAVIAISNYIYLNAIYNKPVNSNNTYIKEVIPGGEIVGIKLFSNGVIVTGFEGFDSVDGYINEPFKYSNIKEGDIITKANDISVENVKHLLDIVNEVMRAGCHKC